MWDAVDVWTFLLIQTPHVSARKIADYITKPTDSKRLGYNAIVWIITGIRIITITVIVPAAA